MKKNRSKKLIGSSLGLIIIIPCCVCLYFSFISYPSTKTIANRYLDAIIKEDFEAAYKLGRSREYCQDILRESILQDIKKFGGAQVRNVEIEIHNNRGSDDELQFAEIKFEYRQPDQLVEWKSAQMKLGTDHEVPGFRYLLCGNMFSGP